MAFVELKGPEGSGFVPAGVEQRSPAVVLDADGSPEGVRIEALPALAEHRQLPNVSHGRIQLGGQRLTDLRLQTQLETGHRTGVPRLQAIDLHTDFSRNRTSTRTSDCPTHHCRRVAQTPPPGRGADRLDRHLCGGGVQPGAIANPGGDVSLTRLQRNETESHITGHPWQRECRMIAVAPPTSIYNQQVLQF